MKVQNKWFILFILLLATILSPLDFYIVNLALPAIQESLQASNSQLQLIVSFYTCAYAVFQISGGRFGDIYGRKRIFILGLLGFIASSVLCGWAHSAQVMIGGRILQGVFGALMIPQVLAILHTLFDEGEKRLVLGLYSFTFGIAAALGQYLGAVLMEWNVFGLGWRILFLVNLPVGVLALLMAMVALPKQQSKTKERMDYLGTLLLSMGLMSCIYPLTTLMEDGIAGQNILCFCSAFIWLFAFVQLEQKRKKQGKSILVNFDVFQFQNLRLGVMISFLYYASGVFYLVFGIYLQKEWHWSSIEAGTAMIPFGFGFIVMSLLSSLVSKYAKARSLFLGLLIYMMGFVLLFIPLYHKQSSFFFQLALVVIGCGMGLTLASVVRLSLNRIPTQFAGLASGAVNCSLQIGSAFGVAALGSVFFAVVEGWGYTVAFSVVLTLICLCLAVALLLAKRLV